MTTSSGQLPPPAQLMQFIVGKWISKPIYVAAQLGIADYLKDGATSIDEIARQLGVRRQLVHIIIKAREKDAQAIDVIEKLL